MKNLFKFGCGCTPFAIGILFIIGGILAIFLFGGIYSLTCQRSQNNKGICSYKSDSILDNKERHFKLSEFKRIYISESKGIKKDEDDKQTSTFYCIHIETIADNISFTPYENNELETKKEIVKKVEAFFNDPNQKELFVEHNDKDDVLVLATILFVLGVILLVISAIMAFIINFIAKRFGK